MITPWGWVRIWNETYNKVSSARREYMLYRAFAAIARARAIDGLSWEQNARFALQHKQKWRARTAEQK